MNDTQVTEPMAIKKEQKQKKNYMKFYVRRTKSGKHKVFKREGENRPFEPVGLLVALWRVGADGVARVYLGWSKKHKDDKSFDKQRAEDIALRRAIDLAEHPRTIEKHRVLKNVGGEWIKNYNMDEPFGKHGIPHSFKEDVDYFLTKVRKYFETDDIKL